MEEPKIVIASSSADYSNECYDNEDAQQTHYPQTISRVAKYSYGEE